ncbi:MAG: hypothetical protein JXL80_04625 [Planctomycetes bacterium]|nr:hypothetical protein [Planctomycetota bacterium]
MSSRHIPCLVLLAVVASLASECAARAADIYSAENAPAAPSRDQLPLKTTVSQHGITWTFDKPARVGRFVNGDWYVVGPVTVTMIDPKPLRGKEVPEDSLIDDELKGYGGGDRRLSSEQKAALAAAPNYCRNGSVLNPPPTMGQSGFDSRTRHGRYDPKLTAWLPIAMKPGDALVSSISKDASLKRSSHYTPTSQLAVLTCLKEPVPADAFRPAYMDRGQTIYLARNLRRDLLPKLEPVDVTGMKGVLTVEQLTEHFVQPWYVLNVFKADHADYQWAGYGQRSCYYLGQAFMVLCQDLPAEKKEPLLVAVVGLGIDLWGVVKSGHPGFPAWGGWNSGYKMPIVFGGYLLGDEVMAAPSKAYPKCSFQEDEQTAYGPAWNGAKVVFAGHSGYDAATLKSRDKFQRGSVWGFFEHLHPSLWIEDQVQSDAYRRCCNSRTWQAQALVARLMKLEKYWAHDAFFDYVDRWMYQEETDEVFKTISDANVRVGWQPMKEWARQGQVEDPFAEAMWKKYRTLPGMPPTDGWKILKPNENGLVMPEVVGPKDGGATGKTTAPAK